MKRILIEARSVDVLAGVIVKDIVVGSLNRMNLSGGILYPMAKGGMLNFELFWGLKVRTESFALESCV